jgi:hypothetical protein
VAHLGEMRKAFRILVGKPEEKGPQEGLRADCRKKILKEILKKYDKM